MVETHGSSYRAYRLLERDVAAAIERVLQTDNLVVEREQAVFTAMIALKEGLGSFADALIRSPGAERGCRCTLTFDKKALQLPGFAQLSRYVTAHARCTAGRAAIASCQRFRLG